MLDDLDLSLTPEQSATILRELIDLAIYYRYDAHTEYHQSSRWGSDSVSNTECRGRGKAMNNAASSLENRICQYLPERQHELLRTFIAQEAQRQFDEAYGGDEAWG